jgi:hypothetical protein
MKVQKVKRATGEVLETKEMDMSVREVVGKPFICVYGSVRPRKTEGLEILEKELTSGLNAYVRYEVQTGAMKEIAGEGCGTLVANTKLVEALEVEPEQVWKDAISNTKEQGFSMKTMNDWLYDFTGMRAGRECNDIYIIRLNMHNVFGAAIMAFPCMLDEIRENIGDFIILPSSIHEIICLPLSMGDNIEEYKNMVQFINATEIAPDEKLSDDVYIYDSEGLRRA